MYNKKVTMWVIIVLLIFLLPITIFSSIMHFKYVEPKEENENHELRHEGKLYFYDNDKLLGTYTCKNFDDYCNYAFMSNKSNYSLDERKVKSNSKFNLIDNRYVFIMDSKTEELANANIILYDLELNKILASYKEVKNYGIGIEGNYYILKNLENKWGVISFNNCNFNKKIDFTYDYIGLINKVNENNKISSDIFAVLNNGMWQLIDINGAIFAENIPLEIFSYNSEYIVLKDNDIMSLVDYKNNKVLTDYKYINFYNKFIEIIDGSNQFYLYDLNKGSKISELYNVNSIEDITLDVVENKIQLSRNGIIEETIAID